MLTCVFPALDSLDRRTLVAELSWQNHNNKSVRATERAADLFFIGFCFFSIAVLFTSHTQQTWRPCRSALKLVFYISHKNGIGLVKFSSIRIPNCITHVLWQNSWWKQRNATRSSAKKVIKNKTSDRHEKISATEHFNLNPPFRNKLNTAR